MSYFLPNCFKTHIGGLILKATNTDVLLSIDWKLNMEIVDHINKYAVARDSITLNVVLECLSRRLKSKRPEDIEHTLALVECLILNCFKLFVISFGHCEDIWHSLEKVMNHKIPRIEHAAKNMVRTWAEVFSQVKNQDFKAFNEHYHRFRIAGMPFPQREEIPDAEALQREISQYTCLSTGPSHHLKPGEVFEPSESDSKTIEQLNIHFETGVSKLDTALNAIVTQCKSIVEMIYQVQPGIPTQNAPVLAEFVTSLSTELQPKIQQYIQAAMSQKHSDVLVSQLFTLNDGINQIGSLYKMRCRPVKTITAPLSTTQATESDKGQVTSLPRKSTSELEKNEITPTLGRQRTTSFSLLGAPPGSSATTAQFIQEQNMRAQAMQNEPTSRKNSSVGSEEFHPFAPTTNTQQPPQAANATSTDDPFSSLVSETTTNSTPKSDPFSFLTGMATNVDKKGSVASPGPAPATSQNPPSFDPFAAAVPKSSQNHPQPSNQTSSPYQFDPFHSQPSSRPEPVVKSSSTNASTFDPFSALTSPPSSKSSAPLPVNQPPASNSGFHPQNVATNPAPQANDPFSVLASSQSSQKTQPTPVAAPVAAPVAPSNDPFSILGSTSTSSDAPKPAGLASFDPLSNPESFPQVSSQQPQPYVNPNMYPQSAQPGINPFMVQNPAYSTQHQQYYGYQPQYQYPPHPSGMMHPNMNQPHPGYQYPPNSSNMMPQNMNQPQNNTNPFAAMNNSTPSQNSSNNTNLPNSQTPDRFQNLFSDLHS